jgi:hypothetical protein
MMTPMTDQATAPEPIAVPDIPPAGGLSTDPAALPPGLPPEAYTERAAHARARGLPTAYIPGGEDPDPGPAIAEERKYLRWLAIMVVAIVLSGFVLGLIGLVVGSIVGR